MDTLFAKTQFEPRELRYRTKSASPSLGSVGIFEEILLGSSVAWMLRFLQSER
jgi:hypothetical protein